MTPTQYELTAIAATLAGTAPPAERVKAALALWQAAGDALKDAETLAGIMAGRERDIAETRALFAGRKTIPLEEFLQYLMPDERAARRVPRYEKYLRSNILYCDEQAGRKGTPAELESAVRKTLADYMQKGVSQNNFMHTTREILRVLESDKKQILSERGQKGQAAQKKISPVPTKKKTARKK